MKIKTIRTKVAAVLMLLTLVLPTCAFGQSDNFFYIEEDEYLRDGIGVGTGGSGTWGLGTVVDFETEEELPLGGGLLVLASAAGLYVISKQRKLKNKDGRATLRPDQARKR